MRYYLNIFHNEEGTLSNNPTEYSQVQNVLGIVFHDMDNDADQDLLIAQNDQIASPGGFKYFANEAGQLVEYSEGLLQMATKLFSNQLGMDMQLVVDGSISCRFIDSAEIVGI